MNIDLHCHTNLSDGSLTPEELIHRACDKGIELLSITDHDTLAAYTCLNVLQQTAPLRLIPGVEFSTLWQGVGIHVVGLNIDIQSPAMIEATAFQCNARWQRARTIANRLVKLGAPASVTHLAENSAQEVSIGRPHFARLLVEEGFARNLKSVYKKYLGAGKPGDVNIFWASPEQLIEWIHASGGLAVLAHPTKYKLTRSKLRRLLDDFQGMEGDAMEVISGNQDPSVIASMAELCSQYDLLASVGSDFHSPGQSWNELGNFPALPQACQPVWEAP